jgi:hypothetical protein
LFLFNVGNAIRNRKGRIQNKVKENKYYLLCCLLSRQTSLFLEENRWLNIQQLNFYSSPSNSYCLPGWSGIVREVFLICKVLKKTLVSNFSFKGMMVVKNAAICYYYYSCDVNREVSGSACDKRKSAKVRK